MDWVAVWLQTGDQVASVVGALAGVLTLVLTVSAGRRAQPRSTRLRRRVVWWLLALTAVALVVRFVAGIPTWLAAVTMWTAVVLGAVTMVVAVRTWRSAAAAPADPRLVRLLRLLKADSVRHRYRFFVGYAAPALSDVYVRQRPVIAGTDDGRHPALVTVEELLSRDRHAVLLGGAGSGKSTLAATVVAEVAARALDTGDFRRVAVGVAASDLVRRALPEALAAACARDVNTVVPSGLFGQAPAPGGQWLVIVDGVDEIVNTRDRSEVLWELRNLLREDDPAFRFLITSRPLPDADLAVLAGPGVVEYELRPFDRQDLDAFAGRWFTARFPRDPVAATRSAGLFLARVGGARLGPVARVPLLATIAAMVYEQADGAALPASRADLYERFVEHLIDGRHELSETRTALIAALRRRGRAGVEVAGWLEDDFYGIVGRTLDAVGAARTEDPAADLSATALAWWAGHAPHPLTDVLPDARQLIDELLRATGLLAVRHGRLVFLHQSFAEFLTARDSTTRFDADRWRAMAANPAARSLAAFAAARRPDADALVRSLMVDSGVVTAGEMIADGVPVADATRAAVLGGLFGQLGADSSAAPESLRVLRELSVDRDVLTRMIATAGDADVAEWTRVVLADAVADVDLAAGVALLRHASAYFSEDPRQWAGDALAARGVPVEAHARSSLGQRPTPLGGLGRQALAMRVGDPAFSAVQRLEAAERLAGDGDQQPLQALFGGTRPRTAGTAGLRDSPGRPGRPRRAPHPDGAGSG